MIVHYVFKTCVKTCWWIGIDADTLTPSALPFDLGYPIKENVLLKR